MDSTFFNHSPSWVMQPDQVNNVLYHNSTVSNNIDSFTNLSDNSLLKKGLRQAFFWRRELAPSITAHTIVLCLLGPQGLQTPNVTEITRALRNVCDINNSTEVYQAANPKFIGFSFNNTTDPQKISSSFRFFGNNIVFIINSQASQFYHYRLLWLPPLFNEHHVHHFLKKISSCHSLTRESIQMDQNKYSRTNVVKGDITLLPHLTPSDLPHLIPLPAPHHGFALLIINGRQPLCLKCKLIGHLRRECPHPKCISCHSFHALSSPCPISTYSSKLSSSHSHLSNDSWLEDASDSASVDHTSTSFQSTQASPSTDAFSASPQFMCISSPATSDPPTSTPHSQYIPSQLAEPTKNKVQTTYPDALITFNSASSTHSTSAECACLHTITVDAPIESNDAQVFFTSVEARSNNSHNTPLFQLAPELKLQTPSHSNLHTVSPRITRSMTRKHEDLTTDFTQDEKVNDVLHSGLFAVLTDEVDSSSDGTSDLNAHHDDNLFKNLLPMNSQVPQVHKDFIHGTVDEKVTQSPPGKRKRLKANSYPTSPISNVDANCQAGSSHERWALIVEETIEHEVSSSGAPTSSPQESSKIDTPHLNIASTSLDMNKDPQSTASLPLQSFCLLGCIKCGSEYELLWPLRYSMTCQTCHALLSNYVQKRYYPIPEITKVTVKLSASDLKTPSSIQYMKTILKSQVAIEIQ